MDHRGAGRHSAGALAAERGPARPGAAMTGFLGVPAGFRGGHAPVRGRRPGCGGAAVAASSLYVSVVGHSMPHAGGDMAPQRFFISWRRYSVLPVAHVRLRDTSERGPSAPLVCWARPRLWRPCGARRHDPRAGRALRGLPALTPVGGIAAYVPPTFHRDWPGSRACTSSRGLLFPWRLSRALVHTGFARQPGRFFRIVVALPSH